MSTQTRYDAYQNALSKITEMRGVKLLATEYEQLENAVEGRLLESDDGARAELLLQAQSVLDNLVEADRWLEPTANELLAEIVATGDETKPLT